MSLATNNCRWALGPRQYPHNYRLTCRPDTRFERATKTRQATKTQAGHVLPKPFSGPPPVHTQPRITIHHCMLINQTSHTAVVMVRCQDPGPCMNWRHRQPTHLQRQSVAGSYQNIRIVNQHQGNKSAATEMYKKAYHTYLQVLGPDHPLTQNLKPFVEKT